jgi:tRNA-binding EMAP/Myf-like protein
MVEMERATSTILAGRVEVRQPEMMEQAAVVVVLVGMVSVVMAV